MSKFSFVLILVSLVCAKVNAADVIVCKTPDEKAQLTLTRLADGDPKHEGWFQVTADQDLVCGYIPGIEDEIITPDGDNRADVLSTWTGDYGVKISMRKGFLSSEAGSTSVAFFKTNYNDIAQDSASFKVICLVVK